MKVEKELNPSIKVSSVHVVILLPIIKFTISNIVLIIIRI